MSEWVSLCIPKKSLWTPYLKNHWRDSHPVLAKAVIGFIDGLICFRGQKVKCQGYSRQSPKDLVNTISQKPKKGISPSFSHRCIWFVDVLSSVLGSKVKGHSHSRQWAEKPGEYNIFITVCRNFTSVRSRMYLGLWHSDWVKRSKVKVTTGRQKAVEFHLVEPLKWSAEMIISRMTMISEAICETLL